MVCYKVPNNTQSAKHQQPLKSCDSHDLGRSLRTLCARSRHQTPKIVGVSRPLRAHARDANLVPKALCGRGMRSGRADPSLNGTAEHWHCQFGPGGYRNWVNWQWQWWQGLIEIGRSSEIAISCNNHILLRESCSISILHDDEGALGRRHFAIQTGNFERNDSKPNLGRHR